jgi:hypothetical protein
MKNNNEAPIKRTLIGKFSISIAVILTLVIINEFVQVLPTHETKLQGALILLPSFIAPIGVVLGLIPLRKNKDIFAKWGVILNIILFLFPFLYMILGTLIGGV